MYKKLTGGKEEKKRKNALTLRNLYPVQILRLRPSSEGRQHALESLQALQHFVVISL